MHRAKVEELVFSFVRMGTHWMSPKRGAQMNVMANNNIEIIII